MAKFTKKPIPIDAIKCAPENELELIALLNTAVTKWEAVKEDGKIVGFFVHSWEGIDPVYYDPARNAKPDLPQGGIYYIIKGLKGEAYPCIQDDNSDAPLGYEPFIG